MTQIWQRRCPVYNILAFNEYLKHLENPICRILENCINYGQSKGQPKVELGPREKAPWPKEEEDWVWVLILQLAS